MQGGLLEDGSRGGTSTGPDALPQPLGPPVPADRWDETQHASAEADRATDEGEQPDGPSEGDACQNGLMPQLPPPSALGPTQSPVGPAAPPGVAGFHDNLRKSQGTSVEGSVRKEALQPFRHSLPMQETQLCSAEAPLPLEEEQVPLQARRRLEEQLTQDRARRQQERSSQPATKTRPFSTLDPELVLNPETLPRASTVAMTKEYSFLRTSVPRA